jgi:hypothetical protein
MNAEARRRRGAEKKREWAYAELNELVKPVGNSEFRRDIRVR